jgi:hypothetical protein
LAGAAVAVIEWKATAKRVGTCGTALRARWYDDAQAQRQRYECCYRFHRHATLFACLACSAIHVSPAADVAVSRKIEPSSRTVKSPVIWSHSACNDDTLARWAYSLVATVNSPERKALGRALVPATDEPACTEHAYEPKHTPEILFTFCPKCWCLCFFDYLIPKF